MVKKVAVKEVVVDLQIKFPSVQKFMEWWPELDAPIRDCCDVVNATATLPSSILDLTAVE